MCKRILIKMSEEQGSENHRSLVSGTKYISRHHFLDLVNGRVYWGEEDS